MGAEHTTDPAKDPRPLRQPMLCLVLAGGLIMYAWEWGAQTLLMRKLLGTQSWSLHNDQVTRARLVAILPKLIRMHRRAVVECGDVEETHRIPLQAFNRRIGSWNAIHVVIEMTEDPDGIAYVAQFIDSDAALPEEVRTGKASLLQIARNRAGREASRMVQ